MTEVQVMAVPGGGVAEVQVMAVPGGGWQRGMGAGGRLKGWVGVGSSHLSLRIRAKRT